MMGGPFKSLMVAMALFLFFSGCSLLPRFSGHTTQNRTFITHWPPPENSQQLRLAVKDNIDMKGMVTSAGSEYFAKNAKPATKDAPCLTIARQRNVHIVGKVNMSEFAVAPSGVNEYYGTPRNPLYRWRRRVPGGSSSGSAAAVAGGFADVAFGTDTAGSVRVPAACCGIVGLKTTFGLVPIDGVFPIEPEHLDTVGALGKDIARTVEGMDLLQNGFSARYAAAKAANPSAQRIRIGRLRLKGTDSKIDRAVDEALTKAGFEVVTLGEDFVKKWDEATKDGNTIAAAGAWISGHPYRLKLGLSARTKAIIMVGRLAYKTGYREAVSRQDEWQNTLRKVFQKVDFIALPTLQSVPPPIPFKLDISFVDALMLKDQNTVAVNFAGNPALALPIPLNRSGKRLTSLQLIGPRRSEARLLNAGRLVETAVKTTSIW